MTDGPRHIAVRPIMAPTPEPGTLLRALCGVTFPALGRRVDPSNVDDRDCSLCVTVMRRYESGVIATESPPAS